MERQDRCTNHLSCLFLHKLDEFDKKIKLDKKLIDKNKILTRKKT